MIANLVSMLSFTENRAVTITAGTRPDLVSPKGHPQSVKRVAVRNGKSREADCYPWQGGGATIETAGLVKVATVRGVVDFDYEASVNAQRMREGNTDDNGRGGFKASQPANRLIWVTNADGERIAMKRNGDGSRLYIPLSIMGSEGYEYRTADGTLVDPSVVHPFVRESDTSGQGVAEPIVVRDYLLERVSDLRIGKRIAGNATAEQFINALRTGDGATARRLFAELVA
jgi:hypothetical protein